MIMDCKKGNTLEKGGENMWEKEEVVPPNDKVEEMALGMVTVNVSHQEVLLIAIEGLGNMLACTQGDGFLEEASSDLMSQVMLPKVEGSSSKV